jgi:hypothetical protein
VTKNPVYELRSMGDPTCVVLNTSVMDAEVGRATYGAVSVAAVVPEKVSAGSTIFVLQSNLATLPVFREGEGGQESQLLRVPTQKMLDVE